MIWAENPDVIFQAIAISSESMHPMIERIIKPVILFAHSPAFSL